MTSATGRIADSGKTSTAADGTEPDARFTFANERTFLAWSRTALALVVAGLGVVQLLPPFPGVPWGRHVLGVPLIVFGAVVAVARWRTGSIWPGVVIHATNNLIAALAIVAVITH